MKRRSLLPLALLLGGVGCVVTSTDDPTQSGAAALPVPAKAAATSKGTLPFKSRSGSVRQVPVTVVSGRAWIGDMGFGRMDDMTPRSYSVSDLDRRWPDATIPYCFYDGDEGGLQLPNQTREAFRDAARYIEAHVPSLRFTERASCPAVVDDGAATPRYLPTTPGEAVLVVLEQDEQGGHAEIGWANTARGIWLSDGIGAIDPDTGNRRGVSTVVHELGHTLGLKHEHQRADRNHYVDVCTFNIPPDKEGDYAILDPDDHETLAPYDYFSRMHYDLTKYDVGMPPVGCEGYAMYPLHDTLPAVSGVQALMASGDFSVHDMNSLTLMYGPPLGTPEIDDRFGSAMAVADFDLDGYEDVIVGAPLEKVGANGQTSGTAYAYKGTYRQPAPWMLVRESAIAVEEADDRFGWAFATGDFVRQTGCDAHDPNSCELPYPDLAVGVPGKRGGTGTASGRYGGVMMFMGGRFKGAVYRCDPMTDNDCKDEEDKGCLDFPECRGTAAGPLTPWPVILRAADARGVTGADGDLFGASLAAGDFDGDGEMDLAVGAPGADGIGRVFIYRGSDLKAGIHPARELYPIGAANVSGARFGAALAAGDFDLDGKDDLAVGAPGAGAGRVVIFKGQDAQPIVSGARMLPLPPTAPTGSAEFGFSLSARNLLNTSRASLVVGAPKQIGATGSTSGAIHLYTWGPQGGIFPQPDGLGHRQAILGSDGRTERFGHSVAIYSIGTTHNDVAVGAPGRNGGKGGVSIYDATSATNLAHLAQIAAGNTDVSFGWALASGDVKVLLPAMPPLPNAKLFIGAPLSMNSGVPAGRMVGYGFATAATPAPNYSFAQSTRSLYTRSD